MNTTVFYNKPPTAIHLPAQRPFLPNNPFLPIDHSNVEVPSPRLALTASFIADGTRLLAEGSRVSVDDEDRSGYEDWVGDLKPGELADHPLLPVVYP